MEHGLFKSLREKLDEILPELEVKGYEGIELRRTPVVVGPADVDGALEELRQVLVEGFRLR